MTNLLCYFRDLRHHRAYVLEEIRKVFWRNMNAFHNAMVELRLDRINRRSDFDAVRDRILEAQDVPVIDVTRSILSWTLWLQWELYHCLLYAEIESYRKTSDTSASIRDPQLSNFLRENEDAVNSLKDVRHKVLHPQKELDLGEAESMFIKHASRTSGHGYTFVRDLQNHLDAFIEQLKVKAAATMLVEYDSKALPSDPSKAEIMQVVKKFRRFDLEVPIWAYLPIPSIELSANRILTSEQLEFWYSVLEFEAGEDRTEVVPEFVRRAAPGMWLIVRLVYVLTAELISYETVSDGAIVSEPWPGALDNSDLHNRLRDEFRRQQVGMQNAFVRIAVSLLMEPIRIYQNAVEREPSCRSTAVDDVLPSKDVMSGIGKYRNIVFHVTDDDRTDPRLRDRSVDRLINGTDWKSLCENLIKWNPPQWMK